MEDGIRKPLFTVMTCATSANLGPGYDTAALALDIFNECSVFRGSGGKDSIEYTGPYAGDIKRRENAVIDPIGAVLEKYKDRIGSKEDEGASPSFEKTI
jgi:homoserine kinase